MSENAVIITFPLGVGLVRADRLAEALKAIIDQGCDPGPRGPHIRMLGSCLEKSVQALREELFRLDISGELIELIDKLERIAAMARFYYNDGASSNFSAALEDIRPR